VVLVLVADETALPRVILGHLMAGGYVVQTAVDGMDAIKMLRAGLTELIISELTSRRHHPRPSPLGDPPALPNKR
jgi:CheY-like chemotaxis protein